MHGIHEMDLPERRGIKVAPALPAVGRPEKSFGGHQPSPLRVDKLDCLRFLDLRSRIGCPGCAAITGVKHAGLFSPVETYGPSGLPVNEVHVPKPPLLDTAALRLPSRAPIACHENRPFIPDSPTALCVDEKNGLEVGMLVQPLDLK